MQITDQERVYNELLHWQACMPLPIEIERVIPTLTFIRERVCEILDVDAESLTKNNREGEVAFARLLSMAIAMCYKEKYGAKWSLSDISYTIGRKTHTMSLYAANEISNYIDSKYRLDDISRVVVDFDLLLSELKYTMRKKPSYRDVKIYEGDKLIGEYLNISRLCKDHKLWACHVQNHVNTDYLFKGKYHIKCTVTNF